MLALTVTNCPFEFVIPSVGVLGGVVREALLLSPISSSWLVSKELEALQEPNLF